MEGYEFSKSVRASPVGPLSPHDVCGDASSMQNYCAYAMHLMTVSLAFSVNGSVLLSARMLGDVNYYSVRDPSGNGSLAFDGPHHLTSVDAFSRDGLKEFGVSGMTVDVGFEPGTENDKVFISVEGKFDESGQFEARIYRVRVGFGVSGGLEVIGNSTVIYRRVGDMLRQNAHNLHGGECITLPSGHKALIVSFGDLNRASYGSDTSVDFAKILIMDYEGKAFDRSVFDTGHLNNMHLALNNRNLYQMRRLSAKVDMKRRVVWGENGNQFQRGVLTSLYEPNNAHDLKWSGMDDAEWMSYTDPSTGSNAVLFSAEDSGGVWADPFDGEEGVWNASLPSGVTYMLRTYMSEEEGNHVRQRSVTLEYLGNLDGAPQPGGFQVIEVLAQAHSGNYASAPMATAIHRPTGSFVFADVFNGNHFHLSFVDLPALVTTAPIVQACNIEQRAFFTDDPVWFRFLALAGMLVVVVALPVSIVMCVETVARHVVWKRV